MVVLVVAQWPAGAVGGEARALLRLAHPLEWPLTSDEAGAADRRRDVSLARPGRPRRVGAGARRMTSSGIAHGLDLGRASLVDREFADARLHVDPAHRVKVLEVGPASAVERLGSLQRRRSRATRDRFTMRRRDGRRSFASCILRKARSPALCSEVQLSPVHTTRYSVSGSEPRVVASVRASSCHHRPEVLAPDCLDVKRHRALEELSRDQPLDEGARATAPPPPVDWSCSKPVMLTVVPAGGGLAQDRGDPSITR